MAWIHCGLDQLWFGLIVVWIHCGLAQISRAYGQRAKSPMRAVAALLARVKIYYNPHPLDSLWFGSIVAWIHCGLDQLRNLRNILFSHSSIHSLRLDRQVIHNGG